jgi:hypothetical protein
MLAREGTVGLVVAIVTVLFVAQPLISSIRFGFLLTQTDTRTLAKDWIETNIPVGAKIAVDWPIYGPPLATLGRAMPNASNTYDVTTVGGTGLSNNPLGWYRQNSYDYLIASSFIDELALLDSGRDAARRGFYESLTEELPLAKSFTPTRDGTRPPFVFDEIYGPTVSLWERERPGPTLRIYRLAQARPHE